MAFRRGLHQADAAVALEAGGLNLDKVARIVGMSSSVLFDKENPRNAINRRISIIVMNREAEDRLFRSDALPAAAEAAVAESLVRPLLR